MGIDHILISFMEFKIYARKQPNELNFAKSYIKQIINPEIPFTQMKQYTPSV